MADSIRSGPVNPASLARPSGYSHGLLMALGPDVRLLFVAGQVAWDGSGRLTSERFVDQFERALENVLTVVREAGGTPESIGSLTVFVTDLEEYSARLADLGAVWRRHMGRHYPAIALVKVAGLVEPGAQVEIQGIAVVRPAGAVPAG
jgi:enamine deaminase RidA (YjgF/YER057c/UK114 family)